MKQNKDIELIQQLLLEKSATKQDVYSITLKKFEIFKQKAEGLADFLTGKISGKDPRLTFEILKSTENYFEMKIAGDILVFFMHTNVFDFDKSHYIWKTSYVRNQYLNSFCGMISVYNFLSDSFKYNRSNDLGYLIARIFINREEHFFVEGKRQLSFLYNDFVHNVLDDQYVEKVMNSIVLYTLSFDLLVPPFEENMIATVADIKEIGEKVAIRTGKRLGFKYNLDDNNQG